MAVQFNLSTKNFTRNISSLVDVLSDSLIGSWIKDESLMSQEAYSVLKNPADREIVDNAVQEMKNNRNLSRKTVTLSNKKTITLSIE